jgi:hypothetical protein
MNMILRREARDVRTSVFEFVRRFMRRRRKRTDLGCRELARIFWTVRSVRTPSMRKDAPANRDGCLDPRRDAQFNGG